jgi:hypothetical protein
LVQVALVQAGVIPLEDPPSGHCQIHWQWKLPPIEKNSYLKTSIFGLVAFGICLPKQFIFCKHVYQSSVWKT